MKQYRTLNDGEIVMAGDEFWGIDRTWIPATEIGKKVTSYTHKMYRRPLTETSSQMTDTCPDCSEHPCDCGLSAGYKADIRFAANFAPHIKVVKASKVAEIIEQRDELLRYNEAYRQDALICANCDAISVKEYKEAIKQRDGLRSAVDYASDQLTRVTEQRDRLAVALKDALYDLETSDGLMACDNEEGHSLFCLEQRSIPKARQALQYLNQNVKGDSHSPEN